MKINFCFMCGKGKPWIKIKNGYFSASAFINDDYLTVSDFTNKLEQMSSMDEAKEVVSKLNGSFAFAITIGDTIVLSVDRERTIPLFYEINSDVVNIYNHLSFDNLKEHGIDEEALKELDNSLFVSGNKTFINNIYGVIAGEILRIDKNGDSLAQPYCEFNYDKTLFGSLDEIYEVIDNHFIRVVKRLIRYLNGRCAVVPLSGGHDSRLIVYYLKLLGYENIFTYTYGLKNNFEAETSEKVAKYLNLKWVFIEYEPPKLQRLFNDDFSNLLDYYSNGVSSVCIQDWYAVDLLHDKKLIPPDSVFVPGHSFDCIAGSFILPRYVMNDMVSSDDLVNDIIWKHYSEGKRSLSNKEYLKYSNMIRTLLPQDLSQKMSADEAFRLYQIFNIRERQAKYICASVKLYEYYGYDWYLPLWDKELVDLWESISLNNKYERKLFFDFTQYKYPELMSVAPVQNPKNKEINHAKTSLLYRTFRKIKQLINYTEFHYCLSYFSRIDVYRVFFATRFLNIGIMINQKMKKIIRRQLK